jgi:cytochrome c peroxidase
MGTLLGLVVSVVSITGMARTPPGPVRSTATVVYEGQLDSLLAAFDTLTTAIQSGSTADAQRAFRRTRTAYKRAEGLIAFYAPEVVTAIEGPLEAEPDGELPPRPYNTPGAFPGVESAIFPELADSSRAKALGRMRAMRERIGILRSLTERLDIDQGVVLESARLEIARVSTLDIAGFDSDRQDDALLDAAAALDGVRETLRRPTLPESDQIADMRKKAHLALRVAADYLRAHADFETMDRLTFVARYSVTASHAVADLRAALGVPFPPVRHLWRFTAASVYDSDAFDAFAYAPHRLPLPVSGPQIVALGARLFVDPRLSGPGARGCAGCHVPALGFTDGLAKRASLSPVAPTVAGAPPPRRTPTLLNAALQPAFFDDERAQALEIQIGMVLSDANEMRSSLDTAVSRVGADSTYRAAFAAAFGVPSDRAVTPLALRVALAAYVRSLVVLNAPFDRAVRGDSAAMSPEARRGFTVFMGKGRCGTCHFAPLFNGTQPPDFVTTDPEIIGVPDSAVLRHARLDADPGRGGIDRAPMHRFAFKVPTVRNSALTGPYMHNGAYRSLDDVVAFYNAGGGTGIGIDLPYQTLFDHPLDLTKGEQSDLIAFLQALTDTSGTVPRRVAAR